MIALDLSIDYPVLLTTPVVVNEAAPEGYPVAGAVVADLGIWDVPSGKLGFTAAVRGWGARWERRPDFAAQVWNGSFDVSYRLLGQQGDKPVTGWWGVGEGLRFGLLAVDWWDDVFTAGIGAWTGGGVVIGRGDVRASLSARADLSIDFDRWDGTVVASEETTTWSYWPGSARVSLLAGVALR